jgi:hypothetical protein
MAVVRGVVIDPRAWPTSAPALVNRAARDGLYDVVFNYTFTDMSPMLVYTPTSSGSIDAAWNNSYIGSAPVAAGLDVVGLGTSAHTSSAPNAYLTFGFVGTGVYLFGETRDPAVADSTSTDAQIRLTVDGVNYDFAPSTMRDALLGFKDKMGWGAHTAVLSVLSGTVSLHNVSVLTNISTEA